MKNLLIYIISIIIISSCDNNVIENDLYETDNKSLLQKIKEWSLFSQEHKIQKGESLGIILNKLNIPFGKQQKIINSFSQQFDLKNIQENKIYEPYFDKDSNICYIVFHHNHVDKYIIGTHDSIFTKKECKDIKIILKEGYGLIEESLGLTIMKNQFPPSISIKLEDVYSWTIDFFHLQKGDYFKIIYKEKYVDDTIIIGTEKITAAIFNSNKKDIYAFLYKNDTIEGYYDLDGNSLKKQFLKSPLKYSRITSKFSKSRFHPVLHMSRAHLGTDFAAPKGTPIMTTADGIVTDRSYTIGNGYFVKIRHNSLYSTQYLHMSSFKKDVKVGTRVKQGDIIGYVGSTGYATGPHVCYRFWKNKIQINPLSEKNPDTKPLEGKILEDFKKYIIPLKKRLDDIN